ncbi:MAG: alpha/beta hydrolase [Hyphomicrobiales bacterium]|uniref:RBBP9/YdeN family alpha/beta hydrolase n=1 Tax=Rhabdaerophilum calidifontis TaxID=2604328 RepID=UPI001238FB27|nr:alpha/beta hydrolase [Rhabdaerophilum calidifontis]MCA1952821.1 alpha/beta hydrolase [Hyphomicrobiales bacterium]MCA1999617.1 alpha/beta hydrolase [Hyphomicrobiales bacterium]
MKTSELSILIVPGLGGSGPDHWQSRWEAKLSTARRVLQPDWDRPNRRLWTETLVEAVNAAERPVVLVAHSLGVATVAHAAPDFAAPVLGAFLVGLSDWNRAELIPGLAHDFAPLPRDPLPFPSLLVASRNDPFCEFETAADFANAWGSALIDAGEAGHLNADSGHGPWPEGLLRFATFLKRLPAA